MMRLQATTRTTSGEDRRLRAARGEWPLVAFTLLSQGAVGAFAALAVARLLVRRSLPGAAVPHLLGVPFAVAVSMLYAALLLSVGHLVRPLQAWRALCNVSSSWLSLEVVLGAAFAVSSLVFVVAELSSPAPTAWRDLLCVLALTLGVGFVAAMGELYRLPARPAWDHPATPAGFFTTAAWLGSTWAAASLVSSARWTIGPAAQFPDHLAAADAALRSLMAVAAVAGILDLVVAFVQERVRLKVSNTSSLPEAPRSVRARRRHFSVRAALSLSSIVVAGAFAFRQPPWSAFEPEGAALVAAASLLAASGAVAGRVLFYADKPRAGL